MSILAHSTGNWLALESLRQMAIRNGGLPKKFKDVMLAAPDVDVDIFGSQIADMGDQRPHFTLFVCAIAVLLHFPNGSGAMFPGSDHRPGAVHPTTRNWPKTISR